MRSSPTCSRSEPRLGLLAAALTAALPTAAAAQMGNPGFMAPDTRAGADGLPATDQANTADILFVQLVGAGGLAEVELGTLARDRGGDAAVTAFGARMVQEHGTANEKLAGIAGEAGIAVPDALYAEQARLRDALAAMDAGTFDLAYMRTQVVDHQKTAQLLTWEILSGQHAALQHFTADMLPAVLDHLAAAREIVAALSLAEVAGAPPEPRP